MKRTAVLILFLAGSLSAPSTRGVQQPAISIRKDASGKTRTFLAGQLTIPKGVGDLFYNVDNDVFTCTLAQPLKDDDVIPEMMSDDQQWSVSTVSLSVGTRTVQYPIVGIVTTSDGLQRAIVPAVLKFKMDIKAGAALHSKGPNGFFIETKRPVRAGDSISVLFLNGPAILSAEAADGTERGAQPWFSAFQADKAPSPAYRSHTTEAWQLERDYIR